MSATCKHDGGFHFLHHPKKKLIGSWYCNKCCEYSLNFDPENFPGSIAYIEEPREKKTLGELKHAYG